MSDALIRLEQVGVTYGGEAVLDSIDLAVAPGQIVTLIGPNGAGKTTLVRAVLGLLKPHRGSVWRKPRLRIGYMPQKIQVDATLPLSVLRFLRLVPGVDRAAALSALQEVGAEHVIDSPIQTVSGGEMQRVLMVSHDLHLVMSATDQVVCLNRHVCCSGHPEQVSGDPAFVELFGQTAPSLAIYHHHHDHSHDLHGSVVAPAPHVHGAHCKHG